MNRLLLIALPVALAGSVVVGCNAANTSPPSSGGTPTPVPSSPFSNATYAKALRSASIKLQGHLPDPAQVTDVTARGEAAYDQYIDMYLDPAQNTNLPLEIHTFYNSVFLMGGTVGTTNYDLPANLATYTLLQGNPVTDLLTADYCVSGTASTGFKDLAMESETQAATDCNGAAQGLRAGVISELPYLKKFGQINTLNMRRTSVTHQLFGCNIYPDADDPARIQRTNAPCADPTSISDTSPNPNCTGWGRNNAGTQADPSDDFMDPALDPSSTVTSQVPADYHNDTNSPARLSKKYQSKQLGIGQLCWQCHGHLNWRRPVFGAYDPNGKFQANRAMANDTATFNGVAFDDNVEAPSQNGNQDYCGALGDTDGNGNATNDDIDPNSGDCADDGMGLGKPNAQFWGRTLGWGDLKGFGAAMIDRTLVVTEPDGTTKSAGDVFYQCMTTRHYDFVLGKTQGELGLQAANGSGPAGLSPDIMSKYETIYESSGWNTKELLRSVFKGPEYLTSQQ